MRAWSLGILCTAAALFLSSSLVAASGVVVGFRVVCADGPLPQDLAYAAAPNEALTNIVFASDGRSVTYNYRGPERLVFYRRARAASGAAPRVAVASATLTPGGRQLLLVFVPDRDPTQPDEYAIVATEEPDARAARGTIRFLNLSTVRLLVRLGAENREIAGRDVEDFRFTATKQMPRVAYGLAVMQGADWSVILDSDLLLTVDRRYLMLVLAPAEPDSLRFRLKLLED